MLLYLFVFICSFSLFTSDEILYPMEKNSKLGEHICRYTERLENHDTKTYVKPCEEGKYCTSSGIQTSPVSTGTSQYNYYICRNYTKRVSIKVNGEECDSDYECDNNLECDSGKCTLTSCGSNEKPYKKDDGTWDCKDKDVSDEYLYLCESFQNDNTDTCKKLINTGSSAYLKYGGIITFEPYLPISTEKEKGQLYRKKSQKFSYIGLVEDGNFVTDSEACKSGFALRFYPNQSLKDPYRGASSLRNDKYLMCVTLIEWDNKNNRIKYNINGENENVYYASSLNYDEKKLIEIELFKKYAEAWNNNLEECEKTENYNNPLTCNVDEVEKWYYFYNNIDKYLFYYAEDEDGKYKDVVKYLIQTEPGYYFYQSSLFLNIKYLISLLFLLLI